jgi:hypothetical protein
VALGVAVGAPSEAAALASAASGGPGPRKIQRNGGTALPRLAATNQILTADAPDVGAFGLAARAIFRAAGSNGHATDAIFPVTHFTIGKRQGTEAKTVTS